MAVIAGVRACICMIAVPTLRVVVCAAIQVAVVTASFPQASAVQADSKPRRSACWTRSIRIEAFGPKFMALMASFISFPFAGRSGPDHVWRLFRAVSANFFAASSSLVRFATFTGTRAPGRPPGETGSP